MTRGQMENRSFCCNAPGRLLAGAPSWSDGRRRGPIAGLVGVEVSH